MPGHNLASLADRYCALVQCAPRPILTLVRYSLHEPPHKSVLYVVLCAFGQDFPNHQRFGVRVMPRKTCNHNQREYTVSSDDIVALYPAIKMLLSFKSHPRGTEKEFRIYIHDSHSCNDLVDLYGIVSENYRARCSRSRYAAHYLIVFTEGQFLCCVFGVDCIDFAIHIVDQLNKILLSSDCFLGVDSVF